MMHKAASIPVRWVSRIAHDDRSVTGWHGPNMTGRMWTINLAGSTSQIDVVFARVAHRWGSADDPALLRQDAHIATRTS